MMSYSVLAWKTDKHLASIVCYVDVNAPLDVLLPCYFPSAIDLPDLFAMGDFEWLDDGVFLPFNQTRGYQWHQVRPVIHESEAALLHYTQSLEADSLWLFDGDWQETQRPKTIRRA